MTNYLIVAGLAAFTGMWGIPAGLFLGLGPWETYVVALLASQLWLLIWVPIAARGVDRLSERVPVGPKAYERLGSIGDRWGAPGIGFVGVMALGPTAAIVGGLLLGFEPRKLAMWSSAGVAVNFLVYTIGFGTMFRVWG